MVAELLMVLLLLLMVVLLLLLLLLLLSVVGMVQVCTFTGQKRIKVS